MSHIGALLAAFCLVAAASEARQAVSLEVPARAASGLSTDLPLGFDGPPPPVLPETVSRDGSGRITLRAVRLMSPLRLDGQLDEAVYSSLLPASDFVQTEPAEGSPATEKTELWIL